MGRVCCDCKKRVFWFTRHLAIPVYDMCSKCGNKWIENGIATYLSSNKSPNLLFSIPDVTFYDTAYSESKYTGILLFFESGVLFLAVTSRSMKVSLLDTMKGLAIGGAIGALVSTALHMSRAADEHGMLSKNLDQALKDSPRKILFKRSDIENIESKRLVFYVLDKKYEEFIYTGDDLSQYASLVNYYLKGEDSLIIKSMSQRDGR